MQSPHSTTEHLANLPAHAAEGVKEIANWITVLTEHSHGVPWADFLHRWENVIFSWTIGFLLIIVGILTPKSPTLIPNKFQNILETIVEYLDRLVVDVIGERGRRYVPFIGTLFLYILCQNLMGVVPGMKASTSSLNTTIALAVSVFFYVQWTGLRENGPLGYIHHLMGSPVDLVGWLMVPLNFPLHVLQEFIKPLSLSLRLFGNILGEDSLLAAFVTLGLAATSFIHLPVGLPLQFPFMLLSLITGTIQALVFALLSTIYISLMLPHETHEEHAYH